MEILAAGVAAAGLGSRREISVVDMGAGKGYLTFAVYDFFRHKLGREVTLTALEARSDLAQAGNDLAARIGFPGLRFVAGTIEDAPLAGADVVIALHACDTATDDAIYRGIAAGASLILCAPCCHKELRPQIRPPPPLERALRHGIFRERQAELITDALRALLLERSGYATKVFEFVSTEHTAKNTMIAAVRRGGGDTAAAQAEIEGLKAMYGIREQRLETLLARRA
jgi:SAM-dependent methyltransferase